MTAVDTSGRAGLQVDTISWWRACASPRLSPVAAQARRRYGTGRVTATRVMRRGLLPRHYRRERRRPLRFFVPCRPALTHRLNAKAKESFGKRPFCRKDSRFAAAPMCRFAKCCGCLLRKSVILLWLRIPRHGIICSVSECEPQAKHEFSGIDTLFLSEHARYAKWELRNML